jgi:hypothetical protein
MFKVTPKPGLPSKPAENPFFGVKNELKIWLLLDLVLWGF